MRDDRQEYDWKYDTLSPTPPSSETITKAKEEQVAKRSEHDKTIEWQLLYLVNY